MLIARIWMIAVVTLLSLALVADFGAITLGGLATADTYYLPLREIDVGESRDAIETKIIETHSRILKHQRTLWCAIHGLALVCALVATVRIERPNRALNESLDHDR